MFIQQVAKKLNITTRTIRHYEDLGIIKSDRLENNYRVYDQKNYDKLKFIVRARSLGFSLKECRELMKECNPLSKLEKNRKEKQKITFETWKKTQ